MSSEPIFYMAPMLGITDSCFRTAFMKIFGGFDLGISPFVRTLQGQRYKKSGVKDLQPQNNQFLPVHPQILTNQVDDFINLAHVLSDLGYSVINLNMGCPVPTAAGKGRGAGLLPEFDYVDKMLDKVLAVIPNKLSIKTRIGFEEEDDLLKMAKIFNNYPLHEVIVHPRTAKQKYGGSINHEAFNLVCEELNHEVVYSGDICSMEDFEAVQKQHPQISKWMFGRGILKNPYLMNRIRGIDKENGSIRDFFLILIDLYRKRELSDHIILGRLKTLLVYMGVGFEFPKKTIKALRKSKELEILMGLLPF